MRLVPPEQPWRAEHAVLRITGDATEIATDKQMAAIRRMLLTRDLRVWKGSLDLPDGYLMFVDANGIVGGISADGDVST